MVAGYPNDNVYGVDLNVMMQKAQQDLRAVGIDLELKPWTHAAWPEELNGDGIPMTGLYYAPGYYGSGQYPAYFAMIPGTTWLERAGQDDQDALVNPDAAELCTKASASRDEVLSAAAESGAILTVEEHNVTGGLGSAVAETLLDAAARVLFVKHGVPDCYVGVGPPAALYAHYRLDVPGTTEVARALLSRAMPGDPA